MYTPAAMLLRARPAVAERAGEYQQRWRLRAVSDVQLLVGLMLVATVLRFATITDQSYWLDESQAVHELRLPFAAMLHAWSTTEWNPPLYFLIAWPWAKLLGTGELALRTLSALLGVAVVPLLYLSGRELVSRRAGLMAGALVAVNPFMIWYSQEAREYMLLVALCSASLWCFVRAWRAPTGRALLWWAVVSALALLTQYFAGFLIAAEGLALVYRARSRASVAALVSMAVLLAPFIGHVLPRLQHKALFITAQPLSQRLQQVPVTFALNTLWQSPGVRYGLLGAAVVTAAVIALLLIGADTAQLRGAGIAAGLAAVVLLVPLLLALVGHDDYLARGLIPAWPPLAVLIAAACTAPRARAGGAALAIVLLAAFLWAQLKIQSDPGFQRKDWRGIAAALGRSAGPRAIVAYDGQFATGPLSIYLPHIAWAGPGQKALPAGPVTIRELDIVGSAGDSLARRPGVRLIGTRTVDGYEVDRLRLAPAWRLAPEAILWRAGRLLVPVTGDPAVILQPRSA
jgi:4-amino-4-deoxy-L-arabinose transferase-like glycosyltransferase